VAKPEFIIGPEKYKPGEVVVESKVGKVRLKLRYIGGVK